MFICFRSTEIIIDFCMGQCHNFGMKYLLIVSIAICALLLWPMSVSVSAVNVPVSIDPPGGLDPTNTPQICLLTFDDTINPESYERVQMVSTNHFNPNGSPLQMTFFANTTYTDFRLLEQLYTQGHEVGIHTITHTTTDTTSLVTWRMEIVGCRHTFSNLCLIPQEDIVGFRAPYLLINDDLYKLLDEAGFRYDSSIAEVIDSGGSNGFSTNLSSYIWPYTFDNGVKQPHAVDIVTNVFPGLFEVPIWKVYYTNGDVAATMDAPRTSYSNVMELWQYNFEEHYNGNRAPFGIFLHTSFSNQWLREEQWRVDVVNDFIDWTTNFSDVWWVSADDLTDFMLDPQTVEEAYTFQPFVTPTNRHVLTPEEDVNVRYYDPFGSIRTSAELPPVWPETNTAYHAWEEVSGGVVTNWKGGSWSNTFDGYIKVSNNTSRIIRDWEIEFLVQDGEITTMYGTPFTMNGMICTVWPSGQHMPMLPGDAYVAYLNIDTNAGTTQEVTSIYFQGWWDKTNEVHMSAAKINYFKTSAQPQPVFTNFSTASGTNLSLQWDESAYGYDLQFSTNLTAGDWVSYSNIYTKTTWTGELPVTESPAFFRIETIY